MLPDVLLCAIDIVGPFMLVINSWFCVEADEMPCLLEKEEDTCTEKVLVALFFFPVNLFSSQPLLPFMGSAWKMSLPVQLCLWVTD